MDEAPERIWAWEGDEQDGWDNAYASVSHVSKGQVEYIRADLHEAEIVRLTADLRDARMQALSDGAQWQDDVARLTAERDAAVAAALEVAEDACDEYPRVAPDASEWPHYDDQINHSKANIRALATDTQRNALAEYGRRMKAEGLREAAKIQANAGLSSEREWAAQRSILARADEIERGDTA